MLRLFPLGLLIRLKDFSHMRFRAYVFLLLLFIFCRGLHAQKYVQWCTAEMLDVHLLLPPESFDGTPGHLLVFDIRNRGHELCSLIDFDVHLPIQDGYTYRFGGGPDHSPAAKTFVAAQSRMAPDSQVHQVIAWSSITQTQEHLDYDDCLSSDGLTATLGRNEPILTIRHLWLEQCGQAWMSSMRMGPFVPGEELSPDWLARYGLHRSDIAEPSPLLVQARLHSFDSIQYLKSTFESGYSGWFVLGLEQPAGVTGECAFRTLRRRETDGQTDIVVNHCAPIKARPVNSKRFFEIMLRDYNMFPERIGSVDYESTMDLVQNGKPAAAAGTTTIEVRDPADPILPTIETSLKPCRVNQLSLQSTAKLGNQIDIQALKPMVEVPRAGRVYSFTNTSEETCLIGGTPELQVAVQPESSGQKVNLGVCRDCSDSLFNSRGQHWITLRPSKSAHFIVTGKPAYGIYHKPCAFFPELFLKNSTGTMQLGYGLASCELIDVSAWRDGPYDNDPLNLQYAFVKARSTEPPPLPQECAKEVTLETGVPFMFPSQDPIQFGLSSRPSAFHDGAPVAMWISNPTNNEIELMSCGDMDRFFIGGFDILDQNGNRVLSKQEVKTGHAVMRELMACNSNVAVNIPPHSCNHGIPDKSSYYKLGSMYTLPAGHYEVVPRLKEGEQRLTTTGLAVDVTP